MSHDCFKTKEYDRFRQINEEERFLDFDLFIE
jgi:hypothetical protein